MIDTYTRLLESVAETEDGAVADRAVIKIVQHLKSIGHIKMLPQILRELRRIAVRRRARKPFVEVASEGEKASALAAAAKLGITATEATVNPSLIRGWRARANGTLIDHSAKNALTNIYQKATI